MNFLLKFDHNLYKSNLHDKGKYKPKLQKDMVDVLRRMIYM